MGNLGRLENISLGQFASLKKLQTVVLTGNRINFIESQVDNMLFLIFFSDLGGFRRVEDQE